MKYKMKLFFQFLNFSTFSIFVKFDIILKHLRKSLDFHRITPDFHNYMSYERNIMSYDRN